MKVNGSFILRNIAGESVLIPVGETALRFNGMVALNGTGALIWEGISQGKSQEDILSQMLDAYEVTREEAAQDYRTFVEAMCKAGFLAEV